MKVIKCPSCGVDNLDTASKCRMCFESMAVGSKPKAKSSYRNAFWVVGVVVVFLVLFAFGINNLIDYRKTHGKSGGDFPVGPFHHKGEITKSYDRFKNISFTRLESMAILAGDVNRVKTNKLNLGALISDRDPGTVLFVISSEAEDEWVYMNCKRVDFLVDGSPFIPGAMVYDSKINYHFKNEAFFFDMSVAKFLALVNAKTVEIRVCDEDLPLTLDHLTALRDFASRIPH
jgi:hypothetical protein